jgi:hypothetical protein
MWTRCKFGRLGAQLEVGCEEACRQARLGCVRSQMLLSKQCIRGATHPKRPARVYFIFYVVGENERGEVELIYSS